MTGEEIKEQVYDAVACDDMFYRPELRDAIYDMVDENEKLKLENAKLRELLSMYMTFARTVARGLCIQSAYPDGMGRKLYETEMRERAMELGIEWCR